MSKVKTVEQLRAVLPEPRETTKAKILPFLDEQAIDPGACIANAARFDTATFERNMLAAVDKAIQSAGLNLNPTNLGELLLIPMPALTEETRKGFTKQARSAAEDARVAVRNIRRDALGELKKLVKDKEISEDEERRAAADIQKITDKAEADIDAATKQKEADLMAV